MSPLYIHIHNRRRRHKRKSIMTVKMRADFAVRCGIYYRVLCWCLAITTRKRRTTVTYTHRHNNNYQQKCYVPNQARREDRCNFRTGKIVRLLNENYEYKLQVLFMCDERAVYARNERSQILTTTKTCVKHEVLVLM